MGKVSLWAVTDGRAGNVAQALGLAEAVLRRRAGAVRRVDLGLHPWAVWLPPMVLRGGWAWRGVVGGALGPPWPDLVIGAGRRVAPVVAAMARQGVRAVQILDPRMDPGCFDRVVVPEHDRLRGANVLTTLGALGRVTPEAVAAAGFVPQVAAPRLAVLVGGPSRGARWGAEDWTRLERELVAAQAVYGLMITPSRRTPAWVGTRLRAALPGAQIWDGVGANPYPGLLGAATAVLVTADSVNMASEAASTGLPLYVFGLAGLGAKHQRFHDALAAAGMARPWAGRIEAWAPPRLAEADRVAGLILPLLR